MIRLSYSSTHSQMYSFFSQQKPVSISFFHLFGLSALKQQICVSFWQMQSKQMTFWREITFAKKRMKIGWERIKLIGKHNSEKKNISFFFEQ